TRGRDSAVGMTWGDFKTLMREEFCPDNKMQKLESEFWCHAMVGVGHAAYTDRFNELARILRQKGNNEELTRSGNFKDDNKRSRNGRAFVATNNPVKKEYTGSAPKCMTCNYHHQPDTPCCMCTSCNRFGHIARDCRVGPRMVNSLNTKNPTAARGACFECGGTNHYRAECPRLIRAPGQGGNRLNQAIAIDGGQGRGNNGN
ncbi:putative reverse transcriptase domain-containing protein, partial [Tanacetum coccineum]